MISVLPARLATWFRESTTHGGRLAFLRHLTNGHHPRAEDVNLYLRLAVQLELERPAGARGKSLLLTSPKSQRLIREAGQELAGALASQLGQRVLLVDAGPSATDAPGLAELLATGPASLASLVAATPNEGVFVLPSGGATITPAALAATHRTELIERACADYDVVILLGSPVLQDPRSLVFASLVDHALLLAFEAETPMTELDSSLQALAARKASGVAVVLARERPALSP